MSLKKDNIKKLFYVVLGSIIYSLGMNIFIVPLGLYSGGVLGIAQLIRTLISSSWDISADFDISGIISFILNIPLLIFAYYKISKTFIFKTLFCIALQSFLLSIIPITIIINDMLTSVIIGGIMCGGGIGILLRNGGSSGGVDIIGVYLTKKSSLSIGKVNLAIDAFVYICVFIVAQDLSRIIYTMLFSVITMLAIDNIHIQNINCEVLIITKSDREDIKYRILSELQRGASIWSGNGAYTNNDIKIIYTVVSKYELLQLKRIVYSVDSHAFMCVKSGVSINGYFEKRI